MKITTELDESDILEILSQRFNTDETDVKLFIENEDGKDTIKAIIVGKVDIGIRW